MLVDGSLRDADWYEGYFESLRRSFKNLKIAILHITAPREAIFERARVSPFSVMSFKFLVSL